MFLWDRKGLPKRPTLSIQNALLHSQSAITRPPRTRLARSGTQTRTAEADFRYYCRETNSADAQITNILQLNPALAERLTSPKLTDWPDRLVRSTLGAETVKLDKLWSREERTNKFAENSPLWFFFTNFHFFFLISRFSSFLPASCRICHGDRSRPLPMVRFSTIHVRCELWSRSDPTQIPLDISSFFSSFSLSCVVLVCFFIAYIFLLSRSIYLFTTSILNIFL